jgi:hypothetical protein
MFGFLGISSKEYSFSLGTCTANPCVFHFRLPASDFLQASYDSPWAQRLRMSGPPELVRGDDGSAMYRVRARGMVKILEPGEILAILLQQMKRRVGLFLM